MLEIVFSSGAWAAAASAVAAAAVIAAVTLLRDYLRLESRARSLQNENELLHDEIRSLTGAPSGRDGPGMNSGVHASRPVPGSRRGSDAHASIVCGPLPTPGRFAPSVESAG